MLRSFGAAIGLLELPVAEYRRYERIWRVFGGPRGVEREMVA